MAEVNKDLYVQSKLGMDINQLEEICSALNIANPTNDIIEGFVGKVVDENRHVVKGATVKIFYDDHHPIIHTITNEDGEYLISYNNVKQVIIIAAKENYITSSSLNIHWKFGVEIVEDIVITKVPSDTSIYYGVVTSEDGKPIKLMNINLEKDNVVKYTTMTNLYGEFLIYNILPGTYTVRGLNSDYVLKPIEDITFLSGDEISDKLQVVALCNGALKGTINGRVYDYNTKEPIIHAFISLFKVVDEKEILVQTQFSNNEGRFLFGDVDEGFYYIKTNYSV